jgi:hypothetical protein
MIFPEDVERLIRDFSKPLGIKVFQISQIVSGVTDEINILGKSILWEVHIVNRTLYTAYISVIFKTNENDHRPYCISVQKPIEKEEGFESINVNFTKDEQLKFKKDTRFLGFYMSYLLSTFNANIISTNKK